MFATISIDRAFAENALCRGRRKLATIRLYGGYSLAHRPSWVGAGSVS